MHPGSSFLTGPAPSSFTPGTTIFPGRGRSLQNRCLETLGNLWASFTPNCPKPGSTTYRSSLRSYGVVTTHDERLPLSSRRLMQLREDDGPLGPNSASKNPPNA